MCVCESISPGSTVAADKSITAAPAGICAGPPATFSIRLPRTKISWFFRGELFEPSIKEPARITGNCSAEGAGDCERTLGVTRVSKNTAKPMCFFLELSLATRGSMPQAQAHCNTRVVLGLCKLRLQREKN